MAPVDITWADAPADFAQGSTAERHADMRTVLDVTRGEAVAATSFPLRPDGSFTVLHLVAGVTEDGFMTFDGPTVSRFEALAKEVTAAFSDEERAAVERMIRDFREIGAPWGVSGEELALVVPARRVEEVKRRIGEMFASA